MTSQRLPYRYRVTMAAAGLLALAVTMFPAGPAMADPTPAPTPATTPGKVKPPRGSITWSVQPSSATGPDGRNTFTYFDIKPGTVIHDIVGVTNYSAMPVTFSIYAADAFTNTSGKLDMKPAAQKSTDVGSWVSFDKGKVTLAPKARANEPFTLTVPKTATPGDHTGGIIAAVTVQAKNSSGALVKVDRRLAAALYLRVTGPLLAGLAIESVSSRYHPTINPFGGGGVDVTYTVHNTGNIRLDLSQAVKAKGLFGLTLAKAHPEPLTDLLPGATYQATVHLTKVFPLGPMSVAIRGVPAQVKGVPPVQPGPKPVSFSASMWATPWLLLLIIIVLVGGFFGGRWLLRVRRDRRKDAVAEAMKQARRDTVEELRKLAAEAKKAKAGAGQS